MSKARDLADLAKNANDRLDDVATSSGALSHRNLIINGAMQIAQRGTSVSVSNGSNEGYQSIDRYGFYFGNSAGGACTISQDTTVPSGYGFSNSYKIDVTIADTSIAATHQIFLRQVVEAQDVRNSGWNYTDTSGNSKLTLSFWARSSKAGIYCLAIRNVDVSGNMYYVKEYTLEADTWKHVTCSIPSNSSLVIDNDNGQGLIINWSLQAGTDRATATDGTWNTADTSLATSNQVNFFDSTSNNFYLTGVQLEVGDTATPFEHRSYGDEYLRCARYYYEPDMNLYGAGYDASNGMLLIDFPAAMRVTPTVGYTTRRAATTHDFSSYNGTTRAQLYFNGGSDADRPYVEGATFDAEL